MQLPGIPCGKPDRLPASKAVLSVGCLCRLCAGAPALAQWILGTL